MKNTINSAIRNAVFTPRFLFGIVGVVIVLLFASVNELTALFRSTGLALRGYHETLLLSVVKSDVFLTAAPILAAIPYTSEFFDELHSGFAKFYLHRTTQNRYLVSSAAACFVSGGAVLVLGILLTWGIFALVCMPLEAAEAQESLSSEIVLRCIPVFISGGLWSVTGLLFSASVGSKYIAYASPFIVYYLLVILQERYMQGFAVLSPKLWIAPDRLFPSVLLPAELAILCAALFWLVGKRRLDRL